MHIVMIEIVLVTHSRIFHPELKFSGVWNDIANGFKAFLEELAKTSGIPLKYSVLSLFKNYNNIEEYLEKVEEAIVSNPDILILPLTPRQGEFEERLLKMLEGYRGIIIAINVPPDEKAMQRLKGKLRGYVGMDEKGAGRKAAERLFSEVDDFDCIYIPDDKPEHYGYYLRRTGAEEVARQYGVPVCTININNPKSADVVCKLMGKGAFISLGPVGTDFALNAREKWPSKVKAIVAMDLDKKTSEAILSGKVICTLIQHPKEQGAKAAELAVNIATGKTSSAFTNIYCGPTVIDQDNIAIFI
ncbi:MAG: substrate-binding domain-containing protein [Candidatus Pacebacteria bacterium]|nr:substrate-binding domain-containing protein [Candidatus Paceibacterota bacterium]